MKMINYLLLVNKRQVEIRLVAESWGLSDSVPCFLFSLNGGDLVVKSGFGHAAMLAGQGPRCIGLRDDLVQPLHFTEGDEAQRSEMMRNCSCVLQVFSKCRALS